VRLDEGDLVLTVILVLMAAVTVTDYLTGNTSSAQQTMAVGKLRCRNSPVERTCPRSNAGPGKVKTQVVHIIVGNWHPLLLSISASPGFIMLPCCMRSYYFSGPKSLQL
jgi:hypothetical protein